MKWWILAVAGLILSAGCGKSYIKVNLDRPAYLERPAWVGVYFLSQESALDDKDNIQLSDPLGIPVGGAVVHKEVYPLHPGAGVHQIVRNDYNPEIRWVLVAAGFPDAEPCATQKVQIKEGAKLTIIVTVEEKCINLVTD